jgi:baculoviral IAP repeat-containing protein 6
MTIPSNYPTKPPFVRLSNTGGKRFNPNTYDSGKVCLSLIGTWKGDKGESWNSETSTFYQLLISIQSQILIDEPYFNEPGYEKSYGTPKGQKDSKEYNDNIEYWNYEVAIIKMIQNPPECFKDVILNHFKYKETEIMNNFNESKKTNPKLNYLSHNLVEAFTIVKDFKLVK